MAGICQPGNAAILYKIRGNIIVKPGNASEIITYIPDVARVKYLFNKKYEREDSIIDNIITITDDREKNSIFSVKNAVKTQYKKRIICPVFCPPPDRPKTSIFVDAQPVFCMKNARYIPYEISI